MYKRQDTNSASCSVTLNNAGLGASGTHIDSRIDGRSGRETVTLSFGYDVSWESVTFGAWQERDDVRILDDDGFLLDYTGVDATLDLNGIVSSSLSFQARQGGAAVRDAFTIAAIEIAPVPVPAAGFLMLAGVGSLAATKRRKKA